MLICRGSECGWNNPECFWDTLEREFVFREGGWDGGFWICESKVAKLKEKFERITEKIPEIEWGQYRSLPLLFVWGLYLHVYFILMGFFKMKSL